MLTNSFVGLFSRIWNRFLVVFVLIVLIGIGLFFLTFRSWKEKSNYPQFIINSEIPNYELVIDNPDLLGSELTTIFGSEDNFFTSKKFKTIEIRLITKDLYNPNQPNLRWQGDEKAVFDMGIYIDDLPREKGELERYISAFILNKFFLFNLDLNIYNGRESNKSLEERVSLSESYTEKVLQNKLDFVKWENQ